MSETGFTDRQLEQIGKIVTQIIATTVPQIIATTVPPLIEAALVPINRRLDKIEERLERIENTPTMQRELNSTK